MRFASRCVTVVLPAQMKYTLKNDQPQPGAGEDVAEVDLGAGRWDDIQRRTMVTT